jgi:hypothetical protein
MANRKNTFLIKRSNVAGKVPADGDLQLGELALNTADNILYASGTTANSILPIGWDRVARTGDTMTGTLFTPYLSATTVSATTYLNLPPTTFSGGTVTGPTNFTNGLTANTMSATTYYGDGSNLTGISAVATEFVVNCRNQSGSDMYRGQVVYMNGSTGNKPTILLAQANSEMTSARTFGVLKNDIANNGDGDVVTIGSITNLDTRTSATHPFTIDTLSDGQTIYLSPTNAGYITNVKPYAPNHLVYIGKVVRTSPTNGYIEYQIQNGYELDELHDVKITGVTYGDLLTYSAYNGSNVWVNSKTLNGSYVITGDTTVGGQMKATTVSATTYLNLPTDVYVTGGTYSSGSATFINNTGGTFSVTGFSTGSTINIGSGTINYLPKWTGSTALGDSLIRDDGTNIGVNTAPSSTGKVSIYTLNGNTSALYVQNQNSSSSYGVYAFLNSGQGSQTAVFGVAEGHPTTGTSIGLLGFANDGLLGIGVKGAVGTTEFGSMATGIGGSFDGRGDGGYGYPATSYSVQLLDGTEGIDKVLVSKTSDGKANWSNELTGLTTVAAVTVSATTFIGDGSQITNVTPSVPYGIITAMATGNYLI